METRDVTFKNLTEEQINAIKVLLGDACEIEEKVEEKKDTFFPKTGDEFYFLLSDGEIDNKYYSPVSYADMDRISIGNCFRTEEEAEFEVERLKVLKEMKKFAEPEDFGWDGIKYHYYLYYDILCNEILIGSSRCTKYNCIFFKTRDDVKDCIEAVGEDRIKKYYLEVEENG